MCDLLYWYFKLRQFKILCPFVVYRGILDSNPSLTDASVSNCLSHSYSLVRIPRASGIIRVVLQT